MASSIRRRGLNLAATALSLALASCTTTPDDTLVPDISKPSETATPETKATMEAGLSSSQAALNTIGERPASMAEIYRGTGRFVNRGPISQPRAELSGGEIIMNFDETELADVVDIVLGQTLQLNYIVDPRIAGQVTLSTTKPVPADAALDILESILRMNGAALVVDGDLYRVMPIAEARALPLKAPSVDLEDVPPGFSLQIVPLRYVSALEMEKVINAFAAEGSIVRVDPERNLLVLAGTRVELDTLIDTVRLFDVDFLAGTSVGIFPLSQVSAETAIQELELLLQSGEDGALAGLIRLIPVERLNAILVATKNPSYLEKVEQWIGRLDRATSTGLNLYVYYVENGKAANLASILSDIFSDEGNTDGASAVGRIAPGLTERQDTSTNITQEIRRGPTGVPQQANIPSAASRDASAANGLRVGTSDPVSYSPTSGIKIIADEDNNALLILSTAQDYRMVEA
ncbi:MAG: secretin N-terminal domain-containing protein, partial [Pseudomonadota bacterium]